MPNEFIYLSVVTVLLALVGFVSLRYERRAQAQREQAARRK